jgi:hypothetical protein
MKEELTLFGITGIRQRMPFKTYFKIAQKTLVLTGNIFYWFL